MATSKPIGPGPAGYILPNQMGHPHADLRKDRSPEFSFGYRTRIVNKGFSPGPIYKYDDVFRQGPDKGLMFSFGYRTRIIDKRAGPPPGAHDPQLCPENKSNRPPKWSFGYRTKIIDKKAGPGPDTYLYSIKPVIPTSPAFSMYPRLKDREIFRSPGPATLVPSSLNYVRYRDPSFTFGRPLKTLPNKTNAPPPNHYNLAEYKGPYKNSLSYSFGRRHHQYAPPMIVECDN